MTGSKTDKMFPEGKKIKIGKEEIVIRPFVLRTRTQVLRIIAEVLMELRRQKPDIGPADVNNPKMMGMFIEIAGEKLVDVYAIATGKSKDWLLDNVQLSDEVKILQAIGEVNDLPFLYSQIKSMLKVTMKKP